MKFKLPRHRIERIAIYLISIALMLLAIDLVLVRLARHVTPGPETTKITEPTLPDGRIDYLTALENWYGQGVTPENNGVPLLLLALGPKGLPSNQPRDGITNRLGMPPLPDQGDYFRERGEGFLEHPETEEWKDANDITPVLEHPWKSADHPRTAAWLTANEKPLAIIAQAVKKPRYFFPFNGGNPPEMMFDIQLPQLHRLLEAGRALVARAMLKAANGDLAGGREDLMTVHQLARLIGDKTTTLIDRLVAYAIDSMACTAEALLAKEGKLDAAEARRWLAALQTLPPLSEFADVIDVPERYLFLQFMQYASRYGVNQALHRIDETMKSAAPLAGAQPKPLAANLLLEFIPVNIEQVMRDANAWHDRFAAAVRKPAGAERRAAIKSAEDEFTSFASRGEPWRSMSNWGWPNFLKVTDRRDTAVARRNLALTAMALALHHAEHGKYPATLAELKPQDLPEIPPDPFMMQSLIYRPSGDAYYLYSVGPNLVDDQGGGDDVAVK